MAVPTNLIIYDLPSAPFARRLVSHGPRLMTRDAQPLLCHIASAHGLRTTPAPCATSYYSFSVACASDAFHVVALASRYALRDAPLVSQTQ